MRKYFYLFALPIFTGIACAEEHGKDNSSEIVLSEKSKVVPGNQINRSRLTYDRFESMWLLGDDPYSGFAITTYEDGMIKEKLGILDGKKQNESRTYFPDGSTKSISNYENGKLHGEKKSWLQDSIRVLVSHLNYHRGKLHGKQLKWYPTGEIFKVLNLEMGKEKGMQKAYRKNGNLYANYEAKKGRIFGLKKAALCFELEDEKIQYEN